MAKWFSAMIWGILFLFGFGVFSGYYAEAYYAAQIAKGADPTIITKVGFYWLIASILMGFFGLILGRLANWPKLN